MKTSTQYPEILLVDNYDSFTYNLYDYFLQLGTSCTVVRNDEWSFGKYKNFPCDGIVFSPGPKKPKDAGFLMDLIHHFHDKKPILGVCLGHQGIGEYFGAHLAKANLPVHGKTSAIKHDSTGLFKGIPSPTSIMRYHSLILKSLQDTPLRTTASTEEGKIMAFEHESLPIHGLQFHPESILSEHGLLMLKNWVESLAVSSRHI